MYSFKQIPEIMKSLKSLPVHFFLAPDYSRVIVSAKDGGDLMTVDSLKEVCRLEMSLAKGQLYEDICQTGRRQECCLPWSLPNYIAMLHNRTSCLGITVSVT